MSAVATAIVGGSLISGVMGGKAAEDAADAQKYGADAAAATQRYMYDTTREDYAPYRTVGASALNQLAALYGLEQFQDPAISMQYEPGAELFRLAGKRPIPNETLYQEDPVYRQAWDAAAAEMGFKDPKLGSYKTDRGLLESLVRQNMEANPEYRKRIAGQTKQSSAPAANDWSSFYDSPDYQFAFDEGNRAVQASLSARGLSNSGAAMKELTRYGQGMASQQLGNYTNRLAALAGIGQSSTGSVASAGMNAAQGIGQAQMAAGDARASGYINRANNITNMINQGTGMLAMSKLGGGGGWQGAAYPGGSGDTSTGMMYDLGQ